MWYSIKDGNWTDPNTWMSNHGKRATYPGQNNLQSTAFNLYDDVYINHAVTTDFGGATITVNNLYVSGGLLANIAGNKGLNVLGDLQVTGTVNLTSPSLFSLNLSGVNNYITNFISGTTSTVIYTRAGDQTVMPLTYRGLTTQGTGTKYIPAGVDVTSIFTINANTTLLSDFAMTGSITATPSVFELSTFNLSVSGTTTGFSSSISKSGAGNILFVGLVNFNFGSTLNFTGNPTVEFRGGFTSAMATFTSGTGAWNFTTNNQSISIPNVVPISAPVNIIGAITVTNIAGSFLQINNSLNGTVAGSAFISKGTLNINTAAGSIMTTGTYDYTSFANTVNYMYAGGNVTLPAITNYWNLTITGAVIKTAAINTTTTNLLIIQSSATFQLSTFALTVGGQTQLFTSGKLMKNSSTGAVLFIGLLNHSVNNSAVLDFSAGNPNIEIRGGMIVSYDGTWLTGTGTWSFTTNNQTITGYGRQWDCSIVITGAITITMSQANTSAMTTTSTINGTVAGSTFVNQGVLYFNNSTLPMITGVFDYYTSINSVIGYNFNGNYTLPYTNYQGLSIFGTGTKTLSGNTTLRSLGLFGAVGGGTTFELSTFDLSVSSITNLFNAYLSKTGAGNILFTGLVSCSTSATSAGFTLTGNPSVEFRGGITWSPNNNMTNTGGGTWSFTTNNQTINWPVNITTSIPFDILISGAITVTITTLSNAQATFTGIVNANNAASTFDNRGFVNYQNATRPMLTGILQCNAAANTFLYNKAGAQDLKGGTYRTLTLAGSGVKTLQGNVVVATLYTLTGPATLALNGFTRT